jgi:hypothetical protein
LRPFRREQGLNKAERGRKQDAKQALKLLANLAETTGTGGIYTGPVFLKFFFLL